MTSFKGGCMCGAVRFTVNASPLMQGMCYCSLCQHANGGSPAFVMLFPKAALTIDKGQPKGYVTVGDTGNKITRFFCAECGTALYAESQTRPIVSVKVGSLDDPGNYKPGAQIFTSSAKPWHRVFPDIPAFPKNAG
ncbi:MAG: GFA family protein [Alphaproteobacteria bacterium]